MPRVNLDQVRSGMVLASEVTDRRGRLLMPGGRTLTDRHLAAFRMWGVATIDILGDEVPEPSELVFDEATLARADEMVRDLFAVAGLEHALLRELGAVARTRIARELMRADREGA